MPKSHFHESFGEVQWSVGDVCPGCLADERREIAREIRAQLERLKKAEEVLSNMR